jgi:hypothetical protein
MNSQKILRLEHIGMVWDARKGNNQILKPFEKVDSVCKAKTQCMDNESDTLSNFNTISYDHEVLPRETNQNRKAKCIKYGNKVLDNIQPDNSCLDEDHGVNILTSTKNMIPYLEFDVSRLISNTQR